MIDCDICHTMLAPTVSTCSIEFKSEYLLSQTTSFHFLCLWFTDVNPSFRFFTFLLRYKKNVTSLYLLKRHQPKEIFSNCIIWELTLHSFYRHLSLHLEQIFNRIRRKRGYIKETGGLLWSFRYQTLLVFFKLELLERVLVHTVWLVKLRYQGFLFGRCL